MKSKIILAVGAHPDDMDFTASGTIARWIEEGATAYYLICTDGSRGSSDPKMTHHKLSSIRRKEQRIAAKILGVKGVFFLDFTDTQLLSSLELKERIVFYIRRLRPNIVITMDPMFYYAEDPFGTGISFINHTDHRAAALATMDAVFPLARDRLTFPEHEKAGLAPYKVEELYLTRMSPLGTRFSGSGAQKGAVINVTSTFEKKLEAIAAHVSQYDDFPIIKERMTKRAIKFAEEEEFEFAESFVRLIMPK